MKILLKLVEARQSCVRIVLDAVAISSYIAKSKMRSACPVVSDRAKYI
ncbi:MAG: hypothetical protein HC786_06725 [Richelia sp. CSU_2_1]|nr:hypothetical protein [Richelia sp. CSU_2_1]